MSRLGKLLRIYNKTDGHCAYCGCKLDLDAWYPDHVIPKIRGGSNNEDNLVPSCRRCNNMKGGRDPDQFRIRCLGIPLARFKQLRTDLDRRAAFLPEHTLSRLLDIASQMEEILESAEIRFYMDNRN